MYLFDFRLTGYAILGTARVGVSKVDRILCESWQSEGVDVPDVQWFSVPDVAEMLGETPTRVRRLLDDGHLVATRRDGVIVIPHAFFRDGEPLAEIRGTVTLLRDAGFDDDAVIEWFLTDEPSLGCPPVDALTAGRKAEVRRVAQALA